MQNLIRNCLLLQQIFLKIKIEILEEFSIGQKGKYSPDFVL